MLGRLVAPRGVRVLSAVFLVGLAAAVGVGAQLHTMSASPAVPTVAATCNGQATSSASTTTCFSGNDLVVNSISRAASIALQPQVTTKTVSNQITLLNQIPNTVGQPCHDSYMFVPKITQWTTPPGCYANIFTPNRAAYSAPSTFGYCNWWVEALHPTQQDILYGKEYTRTSTPVVGAAIWFPPNVQGASSAGHWAQLVAIAPDHYWLLITEMNFGWRGGGFGRVDYRYAHVDASAGVAFIYKA
jgi:hypothetical protein